MYRVKTNNIILWGTSLTKELHLFSTNMWKYRCEVVHTASQTIMEKHTRTQAKRLYYCLLTDPLQLPFENRNLLRKPASFFNTAKLRNIRSWVNRINLALDIQSEKSKVGMSDIRDWLCLAKKPRGRMYFLDDDFEYDSDDSKYFSINFPDEEDPSHWQPK